MYEGRPSDSAAMYYNTAYEAMSDYSSAYYGSFNGFCQVLGGSFSTLSLPGQYGFPTGVLTNNVPHDAYCGNCGPTNYGNPDCRGSIFPTGICPASYFYSYFYTGLTSAHGSGYGYDKDCETRLAPNLVPTPYKNLGSANNSCSASSASQPATGHPIQISNGNKYLLETDYQSAGLYPLTISRSYNSQLHDETGTGFGWQLNWLGDEIVVVSPTQSLARRPDGKGVLYTLTGGVWVADADITDVLERFSNTDGSTAGWRLTTKDNVIENYDAKGVLTGLINRAGWVYTVTSTDLNSVTGTSTTITDPLGRSLVIGANAQGNRTLTSPSGSVVTYTKVAPNLSTVTYPDGKMKSYHYGSESGEAANISATPNSGVTYANALTGIVDENGNRYATYRYDAAGRAYDEELAPDLALSQKIEHNNLAYNVDASGNPTSTVLVNSLGASRTYNFTTILGVVKSTGQSQPSGSGCAASAAALSYDANGNISSRTDFNGNLTTYSYDMTRNLETSRTEGLTLTAAGTASTPATGTANSATRTITTSYHPTWRLPLTISEYSGGSTNGGTPAGTLLKTTTDVYDSHGNLTSIVLNDVVRALTRTTNITYTYSTAVPGLVLTKVVDGSRTDVSDITTYTYYPHDAACTPSNATPIINPVTGLAPNNLGCRGQLMSMTNALNQTTTYDRYNHHGQVEQMTDANGLVTTNTYDLRQRLLSRNVSNASVGSQTTTLTYDGVGQVTQLSMPDNSVLNYTYDAAHRLTDVLDTLGNKVHYSLDSEGNRMNETTTDPLGTLAKTLSRSYDQLSRLQTLTGLE